jgi:hypothetical protein
VDYLEKYWPLIQQHPWAFLWAIAFGATVGWSAHSAWGAITKAGSDDKQPKGGAWKRLISEGKKRLFFPSKIQIDCVKGLRLVDRKALTVSELAKILAHHEMDTPDYPRSDVEQALQGLQEVDWVKAGWNHNLDRTYSLSGNGLDYARKRRYTVLPFEVH